MPDEFNAETGEIIQTSTALESVTRGEIDMQVATAKRYPRSLQRFRQDALNMATLSQESAAECFYAMPRGGNMIEGPGVRLAEIVGQCWGNMRCEASPISEDDTTVTSQGTAWDMERNYLVRMTSVRRITNKAGQRYNEDMIAMTANAAAGVAFRNAVFKAVPRSVWWPIYQAARQCAVGDLGKLGQTRDKWIALFGKGGVSVQRILAMLGKKLVSDIGQGDLATLQGVYTALKEGTITVDEAFPAEPMQEGQSESRKERKAKAETAKRGKKTEKAEAPPKEPEQQELGQQDPEQPQQEDTEGWDEEHEPPPPETEEAGW